MLGTLICGHMFEDKSFTHLWKTKKFERFNYFVIEKLHLLHKLAFVKDAYAVSKRISAEIEGINALRNAPAHAFFPENLRAYSRKARFDLPEARWTPYKSVDSSLLTYSKHSWKTLSV